MNKMRRWQTCSRSRKQLIQIRTKSQGLREKIILKEPGVHLDKENHLIGHMRKKTTLSSPEMQVN